MRCRICDALLDQPQWNESHSEFEPCTECMYEIREAITPDDEANGEDDEAYDAYLFSLVSDEEFDTKAEETDHDYIS